MNNWKLKTINELKKDKQAHRVSLLIEIIYNTIIPVVATYLLITTEIIFFLIIIILTIFVRLRTK